MFVYYGKYTHDVIAENMRDTWIRRIRESPKWISSVMKYNKTYAKTLNECIFRGKSPTETNIACMACLDKLAVNEFDTGWVKKEVKTDDSEFFLELGTFY